MILWLDDLRPPALNGYVGAGWVKTAAEAVAALEKGKVTFASLDHDLTIEGTMGYEVPEEETGYLVLCWLEEHPKYWPRDGVRVHSMNPAGTARMLQVVGRYYGRDFQNVEVRAREVRGAVERPPGKTKRAGNEGGGE